MVGRPPCIRWIGTLKTEGNERELINERIDGPHRIVFGDPLVQPLREEHRLASTLAFDESLHSVFPPQAIAIISCEQWIEFSVLPPQRGAKIFK